MNKIAFYAVSAPLLMLASSCAMSDKQPLDAGERISQRGAAVGAYGKDWSAGQAAVTRGEKTIAKSTRLMTEGEEDLNRAREQVARAEKQIADATATREDAQQQVADGTSRMQQAEADYAAIRAGPSAVN